MSPGHVVFMQLKGHVTLWAPFMTLLRMTQEEEEVVNPRVAALSQASALNCGIFTQLHPQLPNRLDFKHTGKTFLGQIALGNVPRLKSFGLLLFCTIPLWNL